LKSRKETQGFLVESTLQCVGAQVVLLQKESVKIVKIFTHGLMTN